jgi:hypothetical protein
MSCVGSFRFDDGLQIYPLDSMTEYCVLTGPELLDCCNSQQSYSTLDVSEWTEEFPTGGFHVDTCARSVDFWVADDCPELENQARRSWPEWTVTWHRDRYESQTDLTDGAVKMNGPPREALARKLKDILNIEPAPVDVRHIADRISQERGEKVEINPSALQDGCMRIDETLRATILRKAFSRIE